MEARLVLAVALSLTAVACSGSHPQPYSPNYSYVSMRGAPAKAGIVRKGYDEAESQVLVPDACITPDTADQPLYLPSGCANNLNLQFMAQNQGDLIQGRQMGPAMAAPVARAAKNYLDGYSEEGRRRRAVTNTTGEE
ncbi:hypothetical protein [Sinorhizobium alkalisoli]|uniref:hypothetical protein n=1 Tax=Sinorhizobium alkalisoli TaxID=1752398 RepID=UPI0012A7DBC8|nr:hypothetical protein [Sinorhizobium alkalisoli]QFI65874.1 hypothetical protein EKH55_1000 [Sinorhizobium alkalisoli]